jgi:hypothetical protein
MLEERILSLWWNLAHPLDRLLHQLPHKFRWIDAKRFRDIEKFDDIEPTLPTLKFRNVGLRALEALGQLPLG